MVCLRTLRGKRNVIDAPFRSEYGIFSKVDGKS